MPLNLATPMAFLVGIQQNLKPYMLCFLGSWLILITMNSALQKEKENVTYKSKYQVQGPVKK